MKRGTKKRGPNQTSLDRCSHPDQSVSSLELKWDVNVIIHVILLILVFMLSVHTCTYVEFLCVIRTCVGPALGGSLRVTELLDAQCTLFSPFSLLSSTYSKRKQDIVDYRRSWGTTEHAHSTHRAWEDLYMEIKEQEKINKTVYGMVYSIPKVTSKLILG